MTEFAAGDKVLHGKKAGVYLCGNGVVATVDFGRQGVKAWIPIEELKLISHKRKQKETVRVLPPRVTAKSGNGYHLIYNIDLPNDKESADLVKAVLNALASKFDNEFAKVDTTVFNAARIVKAYGTLAAKGDSTPERPHRIAEVVSVGDGLVTVEQLQAVAAEASSPAPTTTGATSGSVTPEQIEENLERCGVSYGPQVGNKWILTDGCPFNPDHIATGEKVAAVFLNNGMPGFHCFHASCANNGWIEFRAQVEEASGKRMAFTGGTVTVGKDGSNDLYVHDYGLSDSGNGDLFVRRNKDKALYCPSLTAAGWFVWDGQRWGHDPLRKAYVGCRRSVHSRDRREAEHTSHGSGWSARGRDASC
jgi:hypothetical protein